MTKGVKVGLVDRSIVMKEFVIATDSYLTADEEARKALEASGLDADDYPYIMFADVEIIEPS